MQQSFANYIILVVEDEPLIAMDVALAFETAGAKVTIASSLQYALDIVENVELSAAIIDYFMPDGQSTELCKKLAEQGIPFVIYSGFARPEDVCDIGPYIAKPATPAMLTATVESLLVSHKKSAIGRPTQADNPK